MFPYRWSYSSLCEGISLRVFPWHLDLWYTTELKHLLSEKLQTFSQRGCISFPREGVLFDFGGCFRAELKHHIPETIRAFSKRVCYVGLRVCAKALKYLLSEISAGPCVRESVTFHAVIVLSWTMDVCYRAETLLSEMFWTFNHKGCIILPGRVLCWTLPCAIVGL